MREKITIDKSGANKAGIEEINLQLIVLAILGCTFMQIHIRQIKYLNNLVEQDHRGIKRIVKTDDGIQSISFCRSNFSWHRVMPNAKEKTAC